MEFSENSFSPVQHSTKPYYGFIMFPLLVQIRCNSVDRAKGRRVIFSKDSLSAAKRTLKVICGLTVIALARTDKG